jgi:hypothetical protein
LNKEKKKGNNKNWRRKFSSEYTRADNGCDDVWIRIDKFYLVKFPSKINKEGKWGLFTPLDDFMERIGSKSPPLDWADKIIAAKMHTKEERK